MSRTWSKFDEKGLARHVTPEAVRWIRLPLSRADLPDSPDGRRRLTEAVYSSLLAAGIRYAPEQYHPELAEQQIRSSNEVLDSPGEGTCLDLATLFAGLCLGFELIPIVVVTETHALCAVSLTHGLRDWDAFDRQDRQSFEEPLAEVTRLRALVDGGSFLAVECTGFAHSETLGRDSVEGANRRDGVLAFPQALEAGRAQLDRDDSPLRFAIDVAVAHYHWKLTPPNLPADYRLATEELVAAQVASGLRLEKENLRPTVVPIPRPLAPLLGLPRHFVDRSAELAATRESLTSKSPVWLTGVNGIGKTTVFRRLAHEGSPGLPDGTIYLDRHLNPEDTAQQVWESFFESNHGYAPSPTRIGQDIRDTEPLIILDGVEPATAERLSDLMPKAAIAAVSSSDRRGEGNVVGLEGLPDEDAVAVFAWHLGRELTPAEEPLAMRLCQHLNGHPARLADAARAIADGTTTLEDALARTRATAEAPTLDRLAGLTDSEQRILTLLKAFEETGLHRSHVEALVPRDSQLAISSLVASEAVAPSSPRYRLSATAIGESIGADHVESARHQATEYFGAWVKQASPEEVAESLEEIKLVIGWARAAGDHRAVVGLGMAAESAAALFRRWGTWHSILEATRHAAQQIGDRASEAYALHQLGTRARLLGDRKAARRLLKQARRIRTSLGDKTGAGLSQHNLGLSRSALVPFLAGTAIVIGLVGGAAAVCAATDICSTSATSTTSATGATSVVDVEPSRIDFGEIPAGEGVTEEARVANIGEAPATFANFSVDRDDVFPITSIDCPETLEPGGECSVIVSFAPPEPGSYTGTLTVEVEQGEPAQVALSGAAAEPADVAIEPGIGEFGQVPVGEASVQIFTVENRGGGPAQIVAGPDVQGEFFAVGGHDCADVIEAGQNCSIEVVFQPERNPDDGTDELIHAGVLTIGTDVTGPLEVPLNATSSFLLPDLSVEFQEAIPIGRPPFQPDVVAVKVGYLVRNSGDDDAGDFAVTARHLGEDVPFAADPVDPDFDIGGVIVDSPVGPNEETELTGYAFIPREGLDPKAPHPIQLVVDSCVGRELPPDRCSIPESSEENNISNEVDANWLIGRLEVSLDRRSVEFEGEYDAAFTETPLANLVADALQWNADRFAEEQGMPVPVAFLDAGTLIPPSDVDGRDAIEDGDLTMLDLVDMVPWGIPVLGGPIDSADIAGLFQEAVAGRGTGAYPHIPAGSRLDMGCQAIWSLVLHDREIISDGEPVPGTPLLTFSTRRYVDGTYGFVLPGFESLPSDPTMAELLGVYVTEALGGVIRAEDIVGPRLGDVCIE
ncbi:MAG TPA: choice-of-anchor D domain-containing protein [Acidimicrobiia bacterium]